MDLKKIFVLVKSADYASWAALYLTSGTPNATCKSTFANKIVFLESTKQIVVNGNFYGTNPADIAAIYTLIGADNIAALRTKLGVTSGDDFAGIVKTITDGIVAKLPAVAVSGSGLTLQEATDETTGKKTYTIVADAGIWEFLGAVTLTGDQTVEAALDAKYAAGVGNGNPKRTVKETGDSFAVTDTKGSTVMYAWDGNAWVVIGSAQGISAVDTTASHGVALTNTASVVGVTVTPGTVAENNASVITGGAAYTAIEAAKETVTEEYEAYVASYGNTLHTAVTGEIATALQTAKDFAYGIKVNGQAQDNSYNITVTADDIELSSDYEAVEGGAVEEGATVEEAIAALDSAYAAVKAEAGAAVKEIKVANGDSGSAYIGLTYTNGTYTLTLKDEDLFNFISANMWEEYVAPTGGGE